VRRGDIVDTRPGRITVGNQPQRASQGLHARPGTAQVFVYPGCRGAMLVADVLRLDKGHSEGLEPQVTEALVRMMLAAPVRVREPAAAAAPTALRPDAVAR
jgi:hypothetical protein